jgi:hypothetical protein
MIQLYEHHLAIEDHDLLRQNLIMLSALVRKSALITFLTFKISRKLQRLFDVNHNEYVSFCG